MERVKRYSTQLSKGTGMINETLSLLEIFDEHTTKESLLCYVLETNYLSTSTEKRATDIVNVVFYQRFMKDNPSVPLWLKAARGKGLMLSSFSQLLMLYCARQHAVFYDFITTSLNPVKNDDLTVLPHNAIHRFIQSICESGQANWSDGLQRKNASYVFATLVDFGFMNRRYEILPYQIADFTVLYLMHELHFAGLSDVDVCNHEDWQLFNLTPQQVRQAIMQLSLANGFIAQSSGNLIDISWKFNSMEEMINGIL